MPNVEDNAQTETIRWKEWSAAVFEEARTSNKLVLLDLFAPWCHWCHVMDETTYSDPKVIRAVVDNFVPVRVDIDQRPDITDRYNRGGFPTTAFLSERGESIWGGTYIPPADMLRIIESMLSSKTSGEIEQALERNRMQFLDIASALEKRETADADFVNAIFEDIFSAHDVQWGGFGEEPKFPHPDVVDLLLYRYQENGDKELSEAVRSTLDHMTDGLYDSAGGGVFRYSVTRNWKEPHYEKMLETNLGFMRNLVHAHQILGEKKYANTARGVADYLLATLWDKDTGGFFSSQDADEAYYKLSRSEREKKLAPKVIKEIYSGWNCLAVSTFLEAGVLLGEEKWVDIGKGTWKYALDQLWNPEQKLVRHRKGEELYLFDDQVNFFGAFIAMIEFTPEDDLTDMIELGESIIEGTDKAFKHPEGGYGDVVVSKDAVGELTDPRRSLIANSRWANTEALFAAVTFKPEPTARAMEILRSYPPKQIQAHGLFAAPFVLAWRMVERGPQLVEVHGTEGQDPMNVPLWISAKKSLNPTTVVMSARQVGPQVSKPDRPFAVICKSTGCSKEIENPETLSSMLREHPVKSK